jgi:outer membrane receptor protein involved in Fe transport
MTIVGVEETSYLCSQKEKTIHKMKKIFLLAVLSTAISLNINATDVADPIDVDVELNDSSRVYDLDAVVIVAEPKENVRLRQQPLSSSLFSQNEMLSLGVRALRELSQYVPSLTMPNYGSRYTSSFYVRGIGSRLGSSSVGMYVDGMPLLSGSQYNFHVYQTDRIDILRGPQATL